MYIHTNATLSQLNDLQFVNRLTEIIKTEAVFKLAPCKHLTQPMFQSFVIKPPAII